MSNFEIRNKSNKRSLLRVAGFFFILPYSSYVAGPDYLRIFFLPMNTKASNICWEMSMAKSISDTPII